MAELLSSVRQSLAILERHRQLRHRERVWPVAEAIERVVAILDELQIGWCLVGAHAVGEYTEPRATEDVDLVIDDRRMKPLLARLEAEFGALGELDIGGAVRLSSLAIDLIRASSHQVFRAAIADAVQAGSWRLPPLEVLIVLKFMAATSPFRGVNRKRRDIVDLADLYQSADPATFDRDRVHRLAATIYSTAGEELGDLLDAIDRGDPIEI